MSYEVERSVKIPVANLLPNPWNPNKTTPRQQEAIAESLNLFSQVLEIIVRPHPTQEGVFEIIDGEHRFQESKEFVYANIIHGLSDAGAKKLTIVLNETRGNADKVELSQLLTDIQLELGDDLLLALPYTELELDELVKLSDVDWDSFSEGNNSDDEFESSTDEFKSISVTYSRFLSTGKRELLRDSSLKTLSELLRRVSHALLYSSLHLDPCTN